MLALSQSLPSYEASVSPSPFAVNSLASNQTQTFSSSLSFSETLAGLQTENAYNSNAPISFPPSAQFQSGTPAYSTQSSSQYADSSPQTPSDSSQSVQASAACDKNRSTQASPTDDNEMSVPTASTEKSGSDVQTVSSTATQKSAAPGAKTDQGGKKNSAPASDSVAQKDHIAVTDEPSSALTADHASLSADKERSPSGLSTGQTAAASAKASAAGRQEASKRHRKANEAAPPGPAGVAKSDTVAATLLAAANSSGTAAANGGESAGAPSASSAGASPVANKNTLTVATNSPNALAFAVKLQSASSAPGGSATVPAAAPQTGDSSGEEGLSQFAEQLQAVTGAATLAQEPAALHDAAAMAMIPGTSSFATPTNQGTAQPPSSSETNSPQTAETEGADTGTSTSLPAPLRSMQVQIKGQDNQRVDLRLVERAGSLSMSVRSLDGTLNRNLQDHLPELMTKLADQPGQAEWWTPKSQMTDSGNGSGNGGQSKQDSSGSQGQQSQTGQDSGKQQGGGQSNQPKWVEELAALRHSNTTRKEIIWPQ